MHTAEQVLLTVWAWRPSNSDQDQTTRRGFPVQLEPRLSLGHIAYAKYSPWSGRQPCGAGDIYRWQ